MEYNAGFNTTTQYGDGPAGSSTVSTVPPSGTQQGTYVVGYNAGFATATQYSDGPAGSSTISTVPPSGTQQGTYVVEYNAGFATSTQYGDGPAGTSTIFTVAPSGTQPGTYIVQADPGYNQSTVYGDNTVAGSSTISTAAPSGSQQGTYVSMHGHLFLSKRLPRLISVDHQCGSRIRYNNLLWLRYSCCDPHDQHDISEWLGTGNVYRGRRSWFRELDYLRQ